MSAGIIYNNTAGLTATAVGNSGEFLQSNGAGSAPTFAAIPTKSAYFVYRSSDLLNVTGDNFQYPIPFNTALLNPGSAINTTTGTFTAPKTANYFMSGAVLIRGLLDTHTQGIIYIRNTTTASTFLLGGEINPFNAADVNGSIQLQFSGIAVLTAANVVEFRITVAGGTRVVDVQGQGAPFCTYWSIFEL